MREKTMYCNSLHVTADFIGSSGWSYEVKTAVVVDGCVKRLDVVDPWRSCGGGCLCVHT